jgi:hypothetical protein
VSRSFVSLLKDAALEKAALRYIQPKIAKYGEITRFSVNTSTQELGAELQLHGETTPLTISKANYRLEGDGEETTLVLYNVKISRDWMQKAIKDYLPEIRVRVPSALRMVLGRR